MPMKKKLQYQTLHCHTRTSDVVLTYEQVLEECKKNNIGVVAFTDHDSLPSVEKIEELQKLKHDVAFITGIEMSATNVAEVDGKIELFHIVGLFVDPTNNDLIAYCKRASAKRVERTKKIIESCQKLGFEITYDDVLKHVTGDSVGRPHIAKAILANEHNITVIHKLEESLRKESQTKTELLPLYEKVRQEDIWQKMFSLFLTDSGYIKHVYEHYEDKVDMDEVVTLIRNAGGIALLAHWSYFKHKLPLNLVDDFLKEGRLDGVETVYAFGVPDSQYNEFVSDMTQLEALCSKYNKIRGGGGDFHKKEDFAYMNNKKFVGFANRTRNLIEKVLENHPTINRKWSSL